MSYDVSLLHPVTRATLMLEQPHHMRGGTYQVGGDSHARLNVTFNYHPHFARAFNTAEGLRSLNGMLAAESIPLIRNAMGRLLDNVLDDYWTPTDGNAKAVLFQLLALAQMRPDGIWEVVD